MVVSRNSVRQRARDAVGSYHEARLADLVTHVADAIDRFRDGEVDAFDVDHVLFQYSRAAKELWKFCNMGDVEMTRTMSAEAHRSTGGNAAPPSRGRHLEDSHHPEITR